MSWECSERVFGLDGSAFSLSHICLKPIRWSHGWTGRYPVRAIGPLATASNDVMLHKLPIFSLLSPYVPALKIRFCPKTKSVVRSWQTQGAANPAIRLGACQKLRCVLFRQRRTVPFSTKACTKISWQSLGKCSELISYSAEPTGQRLLPACLWTKHIGWWYTKILTTWLNARFSGLWPLAKSKRSAPFSLIDAKNQKSPVFTI